MNNPCEIVASSIEWGTPGTGTLRSIPKTIHFIWLGSTLPERFHQCIQSFRDMNIGWAINVWGDRGALTLQMRNRGHFDTASNMGLRSDLLRYEILLAHGGVYVDVDYECLQSLDAIIESCSSHLLVAEGVTFFCGLSNTGVEGEINNGIFGYHPLTTFCCATPPYSNYRIGVRRAILCWRRWWSAWAGTWLTTRPSAERDWRRTTCSDHFSHLRTSATSAVR